jgi:hypothetical protein
MKLSDVFNVFGISRGGDRDTLIRLMRALNKTRFPHLKYFLDLSAEEQAATLARIPLLSRKHDDWFMFRDVERKDTSFFGPMPTLDDIVWSHGNIALETGTKTPKPITDRGSGYMLNNGYTACTDKLGVYVREGVRHDLNIDANGVSNAYYNYSFVTPKIL